MLLDEGTKTKALILVMRFWGDHSVSSEFRSVLHYSHAGSLSGCTPLPPFLWIPPGFNLIMLSHKVGGGVASLALGATAHIFFLWL